MMGKGPLMRCYGYFLFAGSWSRFVAPAFATMTEHCQQVQTSSLVTGCDPRPLAFHSPTRLYGV